MAAVTVAEFASYLQRDVDTATANLLLTLAEGLVVEQVGTLPVPATSAQRAVILDAVVRAYVNPERWTAEQIDDWMGRRDAESAGLYLTVSEVARLLPGDSDAFTIRPFGVPGFAVGPVNAWELNL